MNRDLAIKKMNESGSQNLPFFFIINYNSSNCQIFNSNTAFSEGILFNFQNKKNYFIEKTNNHSISIHKQPILFNEYKTAFDKVQFHLHRGNSYLVNLTAKTPISTDASLEDIFYTAKAKYKILYKNNFVVFSPETFIKISGNKIFTYPMKGTIDASVPDATQKLLNNHKEQAEHATIVDLLRNDLSCIANEVTVEKFRYIDHIRSNQKDLLQVSSEISGVIKPEFQKQIGDIIFSMLPAGSITGAPKPKTLEIIAEAEEYDRGFYTGIAGYYDGENLDSCVLIRFIENENGQLFYKSGGGITTQSIAEEEYQELIDKIYVPTN